MTQLFPISNIQILYLIQITETEIYDTIYLNYKF